MATTSHGSQGTRQRPIIIVPAHNEAAVIARGLRAILADARAGEFDVLVVSNGSTDDTAERARKTGAELAHDVQVIEIPIPSKVAALRAAEAVLAARAPSTRIYVDADVEVSTAALRLLVAAVTMDEPRLGLLNADVDTSASGRLVKTYYRTWAVLARGRSQGSGSGVLAVNAAGASRLRDWPEVLNDDGFVVRQFAADEKVVVDASARSYATRSIVALVRRRARVVIGNRELDRRWPLPAGSTGSAVRVRELREAVTRGEISVAAGLVYVGVTLAARIVAAWRSRTGGAATWSRDASSREHSQATSGGTP